MNKTIRNRKLVYAGGIAALLVPIVVLGMPAGSEPQQGGVGGGGVLARIRADPQHQLGETTLGDVDPASATMTFVLLGFRGLAANQLWLQADEYKEQKQWAELDATVDSITKLQPHFKKVWEFHGWNLAWNVSVEWDAVPDRYYWVKKGGKFLIKGTERTSRYPELYWEVGRVVGFKIGRSDEWRQFRRYYLSDPDPAYNGGQDPDIAQVGDQPMFQDNYLAAQHWHYVANRKDLEELPQRMMARELFRSYPARSQFDYAAALHREGKFNDTSREAWEEALRLWTEEFGKEPFNTLKGGWIYIGESTDDELRALGEQRDDRDFTVEHKRRAVEGKRDLVNYRYWKGKAESESEYNTQMAHRQIYAGRQLFHAGPGLNSPTATYSVVEPGITEKIAELEGLTDRQRKVLAKVASTDVVWIADLDEPELTDERRAKLKFALDRLREGGDVLLTGEIASDLEISVDDVHDDLRALRDAEHLQTQSVSEVVLRRGMARYETVLQDYKIVQEDTLSLEEALMAVMYLRKLYQDNELPVPADYPLKQYWDTEWDRGEYHGRINDVQRIFLRDQPKIELE